MTPHKPNEYQTIGCAQTYGGFFILNSKLMEAGSPSSILHIQDLSVFIGLIDPVKCYLQLSLSGANKRTFTLKISTATNISSLLRFRRRNNYLSRLACHKGRETILEFIGYHEVHLLARVAVILTAVYESPSMMLQYDTSVLGNYLIPE
jgi:hypothetical protein